MKFRLVCMAFGAALVALGSTGCNRKAAGITGICRYQHIPGVPVSKIHDPVWQPGVTIQLKSPASGKTLHEGQSDGKGGFRIEAQPGKYRLKVMFASKYGGQIVVEHQPDVIEVFPEEFTDLDLLISEVSK